MSESYVSVGRRRFAATVLDNPEMLMMWAQSRGDVRLPSLSFSLSLSFFLPFSFSHSQTLSPFLLCTICTSLKTVALLESMLPSWSYRAGRVDVERAAGWTCHFIEPCPTAAFPRQASWAEEEKARRTGKRPLVLTACSNSSPIPPLDFSPGAFFENIKIRD